MENERGSYDSFKVCTDCFKRVPNWVSAYRTKEEKRVRTRWIGKQGRKEGRKGRKTEKREKGRPKKKQIKEEEINQNDSEQVENFPQLSNPSINKKHSVWNSKPNIKSEIAVDKTEEININHTNQEDIPLDKIISDDDDWSKM